MARDGRTANEHEHLLRVHNSVDVDCERHCEHFGEVTAEEARVRRHRLARQRLHARPAHQTAARLLRAQYVVVCAQSGQMRWILDYSRILNAHSTGVMQPKLRFVMDYC